MLKLKLSRKKRTSLVRSNARLSRSTLTNFSSRKSTTKPSSNTSRRSASWTQATSYRTTSRWHSWTTWLSTWRSWSEMKSHPSVEANHSSTTTKTTQHCYWTVMSRRTRKQRSRAFWQSMTQPPSLFSTSTLRLKFADSKTQLDSMPYNSLRKKSDGSSSSKSTLKARAGTKRP